MSLLADATILRNEYLSLVASDVQEELGQYFTPHEVATLMAASFTLPQTGTIRVLDPGAGSGILTAALVERVLTEAPHLGLEITAVEKDEQLIGPLTSTLEAIESAGFSTQLVTADFIDWALATEDRFDLIIQNPPYKKISAASPANELLKQHGIFVPNVYAAFMSLGIRLLNDAGQQVSITPRSWMNGTYYTKFRRRILSEASLKLIHTFNSRSKVFGDTGVLQEAIIVRLDCAPEPKEVIVSVSEDHTSDVVYRHVPYEHVCTGDFIFVISTPEAQQAVARMACVKSSLSDLGITVSTGKVVDFRNRDKLSHQHIEGAYPFLFSTHIKDSMVIHPVDNSKKPQWFVVGEPKDEKLLVPAGTYVLVKRFSAKEEKRRISAAVRMFETAAAFDNKTNYFHVSGAGLEPDVAKGLALWLNSDDVDSYFRVFSGHTQVNATDLRQMKFPTLEELRGLGSDTLTVDEIGR